MKIMLDAGHGGKDPGAVNEKAQREAAFTLSVVLALGKYLVELGHDVVYTRKDDKYLSPSGRLKMIVLTDPDAFVSVHCNASANEKAHGVETIYRDNYDIRLAKMVHEGLLKTGLADRGIKNDVKDLGRHLAVLGDLKVPACLVEIGFLTNTQDLDVIENTTAVAAAISSGIEKWVSNNA